MSKESCSKQGIMDAEFYIFLVIDCTINTFKEEFDLYQDLLGTWKLCTNRKVGKSIELKTQEHQDQPLHQLLDDAD